MAFRIFLRTPPDGDTLARSPRLRPLLGQRPPATLLEIPRIPFRDGNPRSGGKVNPEIASEGPACFSGLPTGCPRRLGFPKFKHMHPLDELFPDAHDGRDWVFKIYAESKGAGSTGRRTDSACWGGSPAPWSIWSQILWPKGSACSTARTFSVRLGARFGVTPERPA